MESLHRLRNLIADADKSKDKDHRKIYQYIEREVLSPKSPIIKQVPPLEVVVYAINNIFYPNFVTRRIPDLLDLLATVEFYRKRTLDYAHHATIWNEYYKVDKSVRTISHDEEEFLTLLESQKDTMRTMYIELISTGCRLDMYLLWTAKPPSVTNFLIRFNEYFPILNDDSDRESPRLFWSDLSSEESTQLAGLGLDSCVLVQNSVKWATEYAEQNHAMNAALCTDDFKEAFPRPCEDRAFLELVMYYTSHVAKASEKVQSMFDNSDDEGEVL
ncbi:hypothetical protein H0H92_007909 [Tricholoma furcatifolium]|nr:hypothetical protein H0H92_007909 [Tricholoma furcatifolium]